MPIKDLSENVRMPRLGKIHLGMKHPEKGYPMKTDHFVLPKEHSDYRKLVELFGEKPKELRILIPVEEEEQWATQYYKAYNMTRGLVCKGDGESAMRMVDVKTKQLPTKETETVSLVEMACTGKECPEYKSKKCHEVMNLKFIIPEVPGLGVWQIDTGSINSILNINSCARIIKKAFGRISMIPLKLTFEPITVNNPEDGRKQTVYVLNLRTDVTMAQLAESAREQSKQFMLEAPDLEAILDEQIDELWEDNVKPPQEPEEKKPEPEKKATEPKRTQKPEKSDKKAAEKAPEGLTLGRVLEWCQSHGKQYNRTWFFNNQPYTEEQVKDPATLEKAMSEIYSLTSWEGINLQKEEK